MQKNIEKLESQLKVLKDKLCKSQLEAEKYRIEIATFQENNKKISDANT